MPCYHPISAFRSKFTNADTGKRNIVFNPREALAESELQIPCGQCIGCRLERSRNWAVRCVHEAQMHEHNCFITLTYAPEHLPKDGSLQLRHFQLFMKRLRRETKGKVRFFHCGEYGEKNRRPHYHACLFGFDFPDKKHWKTVNGEKYYTSDLLGKLWPFGFSTIGEVTFESAAYVARYVLKKITGGAALEHYNDIDRITGEIVSSRAAEYTTMSRRPGIGKPWFDKFSGDLFPSDECVINGHLVKVPKFYNQKFEELHKEAYEQIKMEREISAKRRGKENTRSRLDARKKVQLAKVQQLSRRYENG